MEKYYDTGASRHHGGAIGAPSLKPLEHHGAIVPRGSRGTLNLAHIMPRETSLSRISEINFPSLECYRHASKFLFFQSAIFFLQFWVNQYEIFSIKILQQRCCELFYDNYRYSAKG